MLQLYFVLLVRKRRHVGSCRPLENKIISPRLRTLGSKELYIFGANKSQSLFGSSHRTLVALFPALRQMIADKLQTDRITDILRQKVSSEDKIQFWNELKVISVSRCVVLVLSGVYLCNYPAEK